MVHAASRKNYNQSNKKMSSIIRTLASTEPKLAHVKSKREAQKA